jgi:hypothetical protein
MTKKELQEIANKHSVVVGDVTSDPVMGVTWLLVNGKADDIVKFKKEITEQWPIGLRVFVGVVSK